MNDEPAASNLGDKHATHSDPYLRVNSVNANDPEVGESTTGADHHRLRAAV